MLDYLHFMESKAISKIVTAIILILGTAYCHMPSVEPEVIRTNNGYIVGF